jgi:type II secretion system protein N
MATALPSLALRRLQRIGLPVGFALLTLVFVVAGFPYDRVRDVVAARASQALRAQVRMADFGPTLTLFGPGVKAQGLELAFADGQRVTLESAKLRPAWSLSWLRLRPAFHVDLKAPQGRAIGTLVVGAEPGFDGDLEDVDLGKLPLDSALSGLSLDGVASGSVDLRRTAAGPRGSFDLRASSGSIALPGVPVALPFESLTAKADVTDAHLAENVSVDLQGPMLTAQITGSIGQSPVPVGAPLDLALKVKVVDPSLRPMLAGTGLRFAQDGTADMKLTGTPGRPLLR